MVSVSLHTQLVTLAETIQAVRCGQQGAVVKILVARRGPSRGDGLGPETRCRWLRGRPECGRCFGKRTGRVGETLLLGAEISWLSRFGSKFPLDHRHNLWVIRLRAGSKPSDDRAAAVDKEFLEVPADLAGPFGLGIE